MLLYLQRAKVWVAFFNLKRMMSVQLNALQQVILSYNKLFILITHVSICREVLAVLYKIGFEHVEL